MSLQRKLGQTSGSGEPVTADGLPRVIQTVVPLVWALINSFLHSTSQSFTQECVLGAGDTAMSRKDKVPALMECKFY